MHYLTELANKLVATYRTGKDSPSGVQSEEERRQLVAAIRCALELETGKRKREEPLPNPVSEYEPSDVYSSLASANKE
jgi:hypothetical protein